MGTSTACPGLRDIGCKAGAAFVENLFLGPCFGHLEPGKSLVDESRHSWIHTCFLKGAGFLMAGWTLILTYISSRYIERPLRN